jgi:hypothetical protein
MNLQTEIKELLKNAGKEQINLNSESAINHLSNQIFDLFEYYDRSEKQVECVVCKHTVNVQKDIDIIDNPCYIDGVGQLCYKCYNSYM